MYQITLKKQELNKKEWVKHPVSRETVSLVIDNIPAQLLREDGSIIATVLEASDFTESIVPQLKKTKFATSDRSRGLVSTSRIFGFRSRLKGEEMIKHFEQEVDKIIELFEQKKSLAAVGFPYDFQMFRNQMTGTVRLQTAYIVRTKLMDSDSNLSVFEDFGEGISKIAKGFVMVRWPNLGIQMGVPVGGGTGGHQSYNRGPKAELEARYLAKKYPGLQFKRVDKEWKVEPDLSSVRKLFTVKK